MGMEVGWQVVSAIPQLTNVLSSLCPRSRISVPESWQTEDQRRHVNKHVNPLSSRIMKWQWSIAQRLSFPSASTPQLTSRSPARQNSTASKSRLFCIELLPFYNLWVWLFIVSSELERKVKYLVLSRFKYNSEFLACCSAHRIPLAIVCVRLLSCSSPWSVYFSGLEPLSLRLNHSFLNK